MTNTHVHVHAGASAARQTSLLTRVSQLAMIAFLLLLTVIAGSVVLFLLRAEPVAVLPDESVMTFSEFQGYSVPAEGQMIISARPLFWQERRPLVVREEVEEAPVVEKNRNVDNFELVGLFNAGTESSVIVNYKKQKHRLRINEELAGWQLVGIENNTALFKGSFENADSVAEVIVLYAPVVLPERWPDGSSQLNNPSDF